jgi:hypothetical protein
VNHSGIRILSNLVGSLSAASHRTQELKEYLTYRHEISHMSLLHEYKLEYINVYAYILCIIYKVNFKKCITKMCTTEMNCGIRMTIMPRQCRILLPLVVLLPFELWFERDGTFVHLLQCKNNNINENNNNKHLTKTFLAVLDLNTGTFQCSTT